MKKYINLLIAFMASILVVLNFNTEANASSESTIGIIDSTNYANVYKGPGKNFGMTGQKVYSGDIVSIFKKSNGWTFIEGKDLYGWVWGEFIKESTATGELTNTWVNIYHDSNKNSGTKGKGYKGESLVIFDEVNGWKHIHVNGNSGWIWGEFISNTIGIATVKSSYANLYIGPGKSYGINGRIDYGTTIKYGPEKNSWRAIYLNGDEFWIWDDNLQKNINVIESNNKVINPSYVNVYTSDRKSSEVKGRIKNGEAVLVLGKSNGWNYVQSNHIQGWVWGAYLEKEVKVGQISNTTYANIYNDFSSNSGTKGKLYKGEYFSIFESRNGWTKIKSGDKEGWVWGEFINSSLPSQIHSSGEEELLANVNVYRSAGKSHGIIGSLPKGSEITYFNTLNGWRYIQTKSIQGWVWDEYITSFQSLDLLKPSNVSAGEINKYIRSYEERTGKKSIISGKGQSFIDAGNKYGVNSHFLAALTIHESAFGTSNLSFGKYNLFGLKAFDVAPFDSAIRFKNVEEGIEYEAAYLRYNYLEPTSPYYNGSVLGNKEYGMNVKYSTDPLWGEKIANHMNNIKKYDSDFYNKSKSIVSVQNKMPDVPENMDIYPNNIIVQPKRSLNLYEVKKGKKIGEIKTNEQFELLQKHNDFWLKIRYKGKEMWTFFSFSYYKDYIQVHNLGRLENTINNNLEVKESSKSSSKTVEIVKNNSYVEILMDKNNEWQKVKTMNGKIGWVKISDIKRVFN